MKTIYYIQTLILLCMFGSLQAQNCTVNSGIDQISCESKPLSLYGNSSGLFKEKARWVLTQGPSVTIENVDSMRTSVKGIKGGEIYTFKIMATCKDGSEVSDQVTIKVSKVPQLPDAGADQTQCTINGLSLQLSASSLDSGERGFWEVVSGGNGTFSDSSSPSSKFTANANSCSGFLNIKLRWNVTNGVCGNSDEVVLTYIGGAKVDAGPHQNIACANKTTLSGSCPGSGKQTGVWTVLSGPSGIVFSDKYSYNSKVTNLSEGTYILKWSVSGPCVNAEDTVSITVLSTGILKPISAGKDQKICSDNIPSIIYLTGTAPDSGMGGAWKQLSGAKTSISNYDSANTAVSGLNKSGTYAYRWEVSDGKCVSSAIVNIIVSSPLQANAGDDIVAECGSTVAVLKPKTTGGTWKFIKGPCSPTLSGLTVSKMNKKGDYYFKYTISNVCGSSDDTVMISVSFPASIANAGTDQRFACNVVSGSLAANIPTAGEGIWEQISGPNTAKISDVYNPSAKLEGLVGGKYYFRWNIKAGGGCPTNIDEVTIFVATASATNANAGIDQSIYIDDTIKMNAKNPTAQETGIWEQISGPAKTDFDSSHSQTIVKGFSKVGVYRFVWNLFNACGSSYDTMEVKVSALNEIDSESFCNVKSLTLNLKNYNGKKGFWKQFGGQYCVIADSNIIATQVTNLKAGLYEFRWIATDNSFIRKIITVYATSPAKVGHTLYVDALDRNEVKLNALEPEIGAGLWSLASGRPVQIVDPTIHNTGVIGLSEGVYTFRWTVSNGICVSYDDIKVVINPNVADSNLIAKSTLPKIYVPNAFTPNNDGLNENFKPTLNGADRYVMRIFNRWGQQIYMGTELDAGWDGKAYDKECPQDVYIYEIYYEGKLTSTNIFGDTNRGTLTLIR